MRMAHPIMGAEDFSYVLQKTTGAMAFLGARAGRRRLPHLLRAALQPHGLDESVMARGIAMHCAMAEAMLGDELAL